MLSKVWDEIIYSFVNFNGYFIPYIKMGVIIYKIWD